MGINTFTEGYGGRFCDTGGGILVEPYANWIAQTTGIPEPGGLGLAAAGLPGGCLTRRRNG